MDDLTKIHGIGAATAEKLVAAGIDSFAKLAATTTHEIDMAIDGGRPSAWPAWIAAAAKLVPPSPDRELTDEELRALVTAWDDVRAELQAAGNAVSQLQAEYDAIDAGAVPAELAERLVAARDVVKAVEAKIEALAPLPEGLRLPGAEEASEIPAGPQDGGQAQPGDDTPAPVLTGQGPGGDTDKDAAPEAGAVAGAPETHTTSASDVDGEAGDMAGLTQADIDRMVALEVVRVGESVRAAAKLDPAAALAHLAEERRRAQLMISMAGLISAELAAIELELTRTETVWPLTVIRIDGAEQPIGEPLLVDPNTFVALTKSGAAADHPPEAVAPAE